MIMPQLLINYKLMCIVHPIVMTPQLFVNYKLIMTPQLFINYKRICVVLGFIMMTPQLFINYKLMLHVSGFIMMTPQLFINYKLKSVAHLPWRMLTYKALNTFIDDIFAFVIKMPTLYRLGCLRDGQ